MHALRFAARRALHVDDRDDGVGHLVDGHVAAGLEEHVVAAREELLHQRVHAGLEQRLTAGDLDGAASVRDRRRRSRPSIDCLRPPVNAYGVSHQVQRRSQAASRTNTIGRPTCVDSP